MLEAYNAKHDISRRTDNRFGLSERNGSLGEERGKVKGPGAFHFEIFLFLFRLRAHKKH